MFFDFVALLMVLVCLVIIDKGLDELMNSETEGLDEYDIYIHELCYNIFQNAIGFHKILPILHKSY